MRSEHLDCSGYRHALQMEEEKKGVVQKQQLTILCGNLEGHLKKNADHKLLHVFFLGQRQNHPIYLQGAALHHRCLIVADFAFFPTQVEMTRMNPQARAAYSNI